jgi:hypothetical protein
MRGSAPRAKTAISVARLGHFVYTRHNTKNGCAIFKARPDKTGGSA